MDSPDGLSEEHRDLLLELALLISERRGVDEIFEAFSRHIRAGITFDFSSLLVVTPDPRMMRSAGQYPALHEDSETGKLLRADLMGSARLAENPEGGEYIPKLLDFSSTRELAIHGYERAWASPLMVDSEQYGMLTVAKFAKGRFPEDHLAFLRAAAKLLARAVRQDLELEHARLGAARAQVASELIFALQADEPFESIFERLPSLLGGALVVDYVGLVIDKGEGFVIGAETPARTHRGLAPTTEGNTFIRQAAEQGDLLQFRPEGQWAEALLGAGYRRGALSFLRDGQELRGVLILARSSGRRFDEDEQRFIDLLRSILSQSLANQHRMARTEAGAARARALNEIALLVNAGEGVEKVFNTLLDLIDQTLTLDYIGLLTVGDDPDTLVMVGSRPEVVRPSGTRTTPAEVALDDILALDRPFAQYRIANHPNRGAFARIMSEMGMGRSATIVIREGAEVQGLLTVARKTEKRFDPDEEAFLATLAAMLGEAIANSRRLKLAQSQAAKSRLLNDLAILLNEGEPPEAFFESLSRQFQMVVPFTGLVLLVPGRAPGTYRVVNSARSETFHAEQVLRVEDFGDEVLARIAEGTLVVEGETSELDFVALTAREHGIRRGAVAAIRHGGETVGFFLVGRDTNRAFSAEECAFIELICSLVGQAIANRRKVEEKEDEAIRSQVLSELAVLLQGSDDISSHFQGLSDLMLEAVGFDFLWITTRDPASGEYTDIRTHELLDEGAPLVFEPGAIEAVRRAGANSLQYRTAGNDRPVPRALLQAGFARAATSIIIGPDGPEGLFTVGRRDETVFSNAELAFIELVSALLGQASANYQKAHVRDAEALRNRILSELALLLNNGEPIDAHFQRLHELLLQGVGFDSCSIAVRSGGQEAFRMLRLEQSPGDGAEVAPFDGGAIEVVLGTGGFSAQYGEEGISAETSRALAALGMHRGASFVLSTGEEPEGLLTIGRRVARPFTPSEMAFFEVFAPLLAHAAANERRMRTAAAQAEDDTIVAAAAAAVARGISGFAVSAVLSQAVSRFAPRAFVRFGYYEDAHVVFRAGGKEKDDQPMGPYYRTALESGQAVVPRIAVREAAGEPLARTRRARLESHVITRADSAGVVVGFLLVGSRDPEFVPLARELRLCRRIAEIVGPAMANARAAEREREEAEDQAIIAEAAAAVAREISALDIVVSLKDAVGRFIAKPFVNFGYLNGDACLFPTRTGQFRRIKNGPHFERSLETGQEIVPRPGEQAEEWLEEPRRLGIQAQVATRATIAGSTVGILVVGSRDPAFMPGERELRLCRLIADILGPAMANWRAVERERQEAEGQRMLAEIGAVAAREGTPDSLLMGIQKPFRALIPSPVVVFGFRDGDDIVFPRGDGTSGREAAEQYAQILDEGGQLHLGEIPRHLMPTEFGQLGIQAFCATAVQSAGSTIGYLVVGSRQEGYGFAERELALVRAAARIIGPAMQNARSALRARLDADEQRILAEAAAALAAGTSERGIMESLSPAIHRFLPGAFVTVFFLQGDEVSSPDVAGGPMGPQLRQALASGQNLVEKPWPEMSEQGLATLSAGGIEKFVLTALSAAGEQRGILFTGMTDAEAQVGERELRLLRLIGDMAGPAFANARESARRKQEADEQRFLAEIASAAAGATDQAALMRGLWEPFGRLIPSPRVGFFLVDGESVRVVGGPDQAFPLGPQARRALELGQTGGRRDDSEITSVSRLYAGRLGIHSWLDTAVKPGASTLGYLFVGTKHESYEFTDRDKRMCRLVADIIGPAMANVRESARRQEEAQEQRILAEAAAAVARAADEVGLVAGLREPIRLFVPESRLMLFYHEGTHFSVYGAPDTYPVGPQMRRALDGEQVTGHIDDPEVVTPSREAMSDQGIVRFVDTPVIAGGETLGVLVVATRDDHYQFSDRDKRLLRLIAGFAGPAMANLRESARRQQEAQEQRTLAEVAAALAAGSTEDVIVRGLAESICAFVPDARVSVSYVDGDEMVISDGQHRRQVHELAREALETGQAIGDIDHSPISEASRELMVRAGVKRFVETAATSGGSPIGLLFVGTPEEGYQFSERDLRMLRLIADITGPAMANAREDRRRREDAEDERIVAEVAAVAASSTKMAEIMNAIPTLVAPLIPEAAALYGFFEGGSINYQLTRADHQAQVGAAELPLPLSPVGERAQKEGQAKGSLDAAPPGFVMSTFGLHEYALTTYYAAGAPAGALFMSTPRPDFEFNERSLALLRRLAQVVGPAMEGMRAEAALARQSELYSLMLRSLSEAVILSDVEGRIMFANELGRKLLGAIDPESEPTSWMQIVDLLPAEAREGFNAIQEHGIGSRGRTSLVIDGEPAWFDYEFVPLDDPVMKVLLVAADVTADVEREAEQARHREQMEQASRLAALGELIGGVAHELNNPLTAILGFADVMLLSDAAGPLSEELSIIQKEALRARNVVRDLLFIVKPGTTERSVIPVADLVAHIERLRRATWVQQGIRWEINIDQPCVVWGNEQQLTQVILNLVTNAEQALVDERDPRISIQASAADGRTVISVSDTGAGMDEATRGRVFEPFFTTKRGLGTGLGLPLSYSIIQSHNGEIRVESELGKGTKFTLLLPAAPTTSAPAPGGLAVAATGVIRVLVIDDEPSLRKVCQRLIASMGHECVTAESAAAAIELASHSDFDVVLCDYRLAHETAKDVVTGFERVAPQLIERMVIATGGTTDSGVLELTRTYGLRLMPKPYGMKELAKVVRQVGAGPAA